MSARVDSLAKRMEDARWTYSEAQDRIVELEADVARLEKENGDLLDQLFEANRKSEKLTLAAVESEGR